MPGESALQRSTPAKPLRSRYPLSVNNGSSTSLARPSYPGPIYWNGTAEPLSSQEQDSLIDLSPNDHSWFANSRYGLFSHYVYGDSAYHGSMYPNGTWPTSVTELAANFNATQYAADLQTFGVEYVIFTAWHYKMQPLYPSAVMASYRPGQSATRDLIADLITALNGKGIKFACYIHLTDGSDFNTSDQAATGWNDPTGGYKKWNDFINAMVLEFGLRYGKSLDGLWVDMVFSSDFQTRIDKTRLAKTLLKGNPNRVRIGNGRNDGANPATLGAIEYSTQEYIPTPASINDFVAAANHDLTIATNTGKWFSAAPTGTNATLFADADIYRFTVLQAAVNINGGGMAWNVSPFVGSGALWEDGMKTQMTNVAALVNQAAGALKGTTASKRWTTPNTSTLNNLARPFVAVTGANGNEYLHVLKPPGGATINTTAPADSTVFVSAKRLPSGTEAPLGVGAKLAVSLPPGDTWSTTDTILELTPGTAYAADDFERPDAATPGSTPIGNLAWGLSGGATTGSTIIDTGSLGFSGITGGSARYAVVNTGASDNFTAGAIMRTPPTNLRPNFVFLHKDTNNMYVMAGDGTGKWKLDQIVGGTATTLVTSTYTCTAGDWVKVKRAGSTITAWVNGNQIYTGTVNATLSSLAGTYVGFRTYLDALEVRWEWMKVYAS